MSIPCGHTYCMRCINKYWDQVDATSQFSCPQCRDAFSPRPVLRRNTVLAELVDKLKLSSEASFLSTASPDHYMGGVGDVACDFCPIDSKLKAVKSCLVCLASFCEMHVLPHREVGTLRRHKLVAAVECLADRLCAQHRLGLEPSGTGADGEVAEEWTGDCLLCEADHEEIHNVDGQRSRRRVNSTAHPPVDYICLNRNGYTFHMEVFYCNTVHPKHIQVKISHSFCLLLTFYLLFQCLKLSNEVAVYLTNNYVLQDSQRL